jgi:phosphopantetheinyl transferase
MWVCQEAFLKATGKGWLSSDNLHLMYSQASMGKEAQDPDIEKRTPLLYYFECIHGYASALYREEPAKTHHYFYEDFL